MNPLILIGAAIMLFGLMTGEEKQPEITPTAKPKKKKAKPVTIEQQPENEPYKEKTPESDVIDLGQVPPSDD